MPIPAPRWPYLAPAWPRHPAFPSAPLAHGECRASQCNASCLPAQVSRCQESPPGASSSTHSCCLSAPQGRRKELTRPGCPSPVPGSTWPFGPPGICSQVPICWQLAKMQALGPANWLALRVSQKHACARAGAKASQSLKGSQEVDPPRQEVRASAVLSCPPQWHDSKAHQMAQGCWPLPTLGLGPPPLVEVNFRSGGGRKCV